MASITYILQFRGKGTPGSDPTKLKITSAADSLNVSTTITYAGVASTLEVCPGDNASFESNVTFLGTTSFQESGTIRFPGGHVLNFSTVRWLSYSKTKLPVFPFSWLSEEVVDYFLTRAQRSKSISLAVPSTCHHRQPKP